MRRLLLILAFLLSVLAGLRLLPHPSLREFKALSTAIYDRNGELLRLTLAKDEQYRLWLPLEKMDPRLVEAVQLYEDHFFYWHPGFNPLALLRSAFATYAQGNKQGGSTLTMQVARNLYRISSRKLGGKFKQILAAAWLELRYSKREILEAYLNLAPYGGNIEGAATASRIYFHKTPRQLTLPETLTLAVIPQNPNRRGLSRSGSEELLEARRRLFSRWLARHPDAARYAEELQTAPHFFSAADLPFRAPHFTDKLLAEARRNPDFKPGEWFSSLELHLQSSLERTLAQFLSHQSEQGIQNAAALLLDRQTGEVQALVGSADYFNEKIHGQVSGVTAKRSPGSTLKPFVYALGMDQGLLHPRTILKDAPTSFGPFSPENFDGRFAGPIAAEDALTRSRNIPAVSVAEKLSHPTFYEFLQKAEISRLAPQAHYGLTLVLGGGELTMEELARLYLMLANRGVALPVLELREENPLKKNPPRLLSEEAAFIALQMLEGNPRPDTGMPASPPVAWKTGTSWGFRDAWTAGIFGRYVLVVWVGNFDGTGNPAFVGIHSAAPLFFKIVDAVRGEGLDPGTPELPPPTDAVRLEVCATSGDLPNEWCPERVMTWFIPGKSPIKLSTLHRPVKIDTRTGKPTCEDGTHVKTEVFEFWPGDLLRLFREAGLPRREAPILPHCAGAISPGNLGKGPQILAPRRGLTYLFRLSKPTPLALRANAGEARQNLFWFVDEGFIGQSGDGQALAWTPLKAGRHQIQVLDAEGKGDSREVAVEFIP
ncbi:MAG TPA: penicillin-binding protein 1C [Deltaproteobacteria bacterium]|nr:penicillin-binding protein 1C [Deltaproteobacteria bacterium]